MSSRFGDGHSKKYATLTSFAAELATVAVRVNANKIPRTVLIIFFIVLPYGLFNNGDLKLNSIRSKQKIAIV
jgi:hypothetical protein